MLRRFGRRRLASGLFSLLLTVPLTAATGDVPQASGSGASAAARFESIIVALGGRERIVAPTVFQGSLLRRTVAIRRLVRADDIRKNEAHLRQLRAKAQKTQTDAEPEPLEAETSASWDPAVVQIVVFSAHERFDIGPSGARHRLLVSATAETGRPVTVVATRNGGKFELTRTIGDKVKHEARDVADAWVNPFPLIGFLQTILTSGSFAIVDLPPGDGAAEDVLLKVTGGPLAGTWRLRRSSTTQLPSELEYLDGAPTLFKKALGKAAAAGRGRLGYRQRFDSYATVEGLTYPTLTRSTLRYPADRAGNPTAKDSKWDAEGTDVIALMSLSVGRSSAGDAAASGPPAESGRAGEGTAAQSPEVDALAGMRQFYSQVLWTALFTPTVYSGIRRDNPNPLNSAPFISLSPEWAEFYDIRTQFRGAEPYERDDLRRQLSDDRDRVVKILTDRAVLHDASPLRAAFDEAAAVAGQGLSVTIGSGAQKWGRCFDADNLAIVLARVVTHLDAVLESFGSGASNAADFYRSIGVDLPTLAKAQVDLERNQHGVSREARIGLSIASTAASAAVGLMQGLAASRSAWTAASTFVGPTTAAQSALWFLSSALYGASRGATPEVFPRELPMIGNTPTLRPPKRH